MRRVFIVLLVHDTKGNSLYETESPKLVPVKLAILRERD